jgi:hypothetical protein
MTATTSASRTNATLSYPSPSTPRLIDDANGRAQQQRQQKLQFPAPRVLGSRDSFLIFIKILFKCIERSSNTGRLRQRAKAIVSECTRRNRVGDSNYSTLQVAVENRLKNIVGEMFWNQAKFYTGHYCQRRGFERISDTQTT